MRTIYFLIFVVVMARAQEISEEPEPEAEGNNVSQIEEDTNAFIDKVNKIVESFYQESTSQKAEVSFETTTKKAEAATEGTTKKAEVTTKKAETTTNTAETTSETIETTTKKAEITSEKVPFIEIENRVENAENNIIPEEPLEDNVWLPELRGIDLSHLGREGEIVAEFSVGSPGASSKPLVEETEEEEDDTAHTGGDKIKRKVVVTLPDEEKQAVSSDNKRNRVAKPTFACTDPDAVIKLVGDGDEYDQSEDGVVTLKKASTRVGLFGIAFTGVHVQGRCCWEMFSRVGYSGKMIRVCPGKYAANDLPSFTGKIRSLRPLDYAKFKLFGR